ncbi:MAG: AraC family transcriptional regulator [Clostridia bacterium]
MASKKKEINDRKYYKRVVRIYASVIFCIVALVGFASYLIIEANENENAVIINDNKFLTEVTAFENTYRDFFEISEVFKLENSFTLFTLTNSDDKESAIISELRNALIEISDENSQIGAKFIVYHEDLELAVTRSGGSSLDNALSTLDIASRELKVVVEYLNYSQDEEFSILTDEHLYFITQKNVGSKNAYLICYKDFDSIYVNSENFGDMFFWENAQNVLDLRTPTTQESSTNQSLFYVTTISSGELVSNKNEDTQYRMYKSDYFDIMYCLISQTDATEELVTTILMLIAILIPVFLMIYLITDRLTMMVFYPITKLLEYVSSEADDVDFSDGEIHGITAYIRKLQNQNLELHKQLEQMTIKARFAVNNSQIDADNELLSLQGEGDKLSRALEDDEKLKDNLAQYVLDHISQDIGLRDVADHFGMSFAYMSTLFKNKMEMNFKEYVSYQRYLHSLDIMKENPKMKIADIAERVGIVNLNTFIRIFKKYNDITPKQYMSMLEKEQDDEKN